MSRDDLICPMLVGVLPILAEPVLVYELVKREIRMCLYTYMNKLAYYHNNKKFDNNQD